MFSRFALLLAPLLSLLISPHAIASDAASQKARSFDLTYQVQWGDSPLGKALAQWEIDETSYQFEGQVFTEGTLAFFYEFEGQNTLKGTIRDNQYQPDSFQSVSTFDDETYTVDMSWPKGLNRPVFSVEPEPEKDEVHPLRQATLRNVADPYTAMLMALSDFDASGKCEGKYRVFDGRRRSEFYLKDFGETTIEADKDWGYDGPAHICGSASKMIGGHKIKGSKDDEELDFEKVKIFIAKPDGKTTMPVRIEVNNFFGSVIIRLNMTESKFN